MSRAPVQQLFLSHLASFTLCIVGFKEPLLSVCKDLLKRVVAKIAEAFQSETMHQRKPVFPLKTALCVGSVQITPWRMRRRKRSSVRQSEQLLATGWSLHYHIYSLTILTYEETVRGGVHLASSQEGHYRCIRHCTFHLEQCL